MHVIVCFSPKNELTKVNPAKWSGMVVTPDKCVNRVDIAHVELHACNERRSATEQ